MFPALFSLVYTNYPAPGFSNKTIFFNFRPTIVYLPDEAAIQKPQNSTNIVYPKRIQPNSLGVHARVLSINQLITPQNVRFYRISQIFWSTLPAHFPLYVSKNAVALSRNNGRLSQSHFQLLSNAILPHRRSIVASTSGVVKQQCPTNTLPVGQSIKIKSGDWRVYWSPPTCC